MDGAIGAFLALGLVALWWYSAIQARDLARDLARNFCRRQGWQLLDQTVALVSMRPARHNDRMSWKRRYRFDFSPDGGRRLSGELMLIGNHLESISADLENGGRLIE
jgi:hypothetical protein